MKASKTSPLVAILLAGISATSLAARETMTVTQDEVTFKVGRFDDGRSRPYTVVFNDDNVTSKYSFNTDGFVTKIKVGTEKYKVVYRTNGDLRRVRRTDSGARRLDIEDVEDVDEDGMFGQRRLYACHDCEEAWNAVCDEGVPSVCSIVAYGSPLTDTASASLGTFCESFGSACSLFGGDAACTDQCECERSLAISLEWYSDGDLDLHVYEASGIEVYYSNRNGDYGFLDNDNRSGPDSEPENYLLYSGLSVDSGNVLGDYTAVVELYDGSGSIPWKLTATSNGEELWVKEGDFADIEGDYSGNFTATVSEYIDTGCTNTAAAGDVDVSGDSEKYRSNP